MSTVLNRSLVISVVFFTLLLTACGGNEPEIRLRLTPAERSRIDTLYQERIAILRPQWDSLCELRRDSLIATARDSIVRERLEEEAALRQRQSETR